jgi:hypothetical protein
MQADLCGSLAESAQRADAIRRFRLGGQRGVFAADDKQLSGRGSMDRTAVLCRLQQRGVAVG